MRVSAGKNARRRAYKSIHAFFFSLCANPAHYDKLHANGLVSAQTTAKAREQVLRLHRADIDRAATSRQLEAEVLESVLRVGYEVGGVWLREHWRPHARLQALIDAFVAKNFGTANGEDSTYVVGLQMRSDFIDADTDVNTFLECARGVEGRLMKNEPQRRVKWFVATESGELMRRLEAVMPKRVLDLNGQSLSHWQRVIMDIELLSRCHELIVTGGSTFGFLAAMRSGRLPLYVNGRANMSECARTSLSRPPLRIRDASFK